MANYSIAEVETLTGIQAHTLRIWERRYGIIKANRTDTKIRFYDDEQLKLLLNISILLNAGYRISKIDKLERQEIDNLVFDSMHENGTKTEGDIQGMVVSMLNMDEDLFHEIFNKYCEEFGILKTVEKLIYPFLFQVGLLWGTNRAMPAQEHFVSNLIRLKLFAEIEKLPAPKKNAKKLVLFMPEGENHEIGLLLGNFIARKHGFRTYYLGQNVPPKDVIKVCNTVGAELALTVIVLWRELYADQLRQITEALNATILISGIPQDNPLSSNDLYVVIGGPADLISRLKELKGK